MASFAGFEMPLQYTSVKEEALAVRKKVGVFDVSHMGEFICQGKDAVVFVDYLLCNDFASLPVGKALYSPLCNQEGKIIDDLIAYKLTGERVLICVNAGNIKKDWQWIKSHSGGFDITLENISDATNLLAVQGPKSAEVLQKICGLKNINAPYYGVFEEGELLFARTGYTGEDGFEIFTSKEKVSELWKQLLEAGVVPCGLAARDVLRIEVGFPLYGNELTEKVTPLDVGLKWTVKLETDDFVGKSALQKHQSQTRLIHLSLEKGIPRAGYSILNGKEEEIGRVTSGTMSVMLGKGVCMGLVTASNFSGDEKFFIKIRDKVYSAVQSKRAFVSGGHK